jgi:hypothetical protein
MGLFGCSDVLGEPMHPLNPLGGDDTATWPRVAVKPARGSQDDKHATVDVVVLDLVVVQHNLASPQLLVENSEEVCDDFGGVGRERRERVVNEHLTSGQVEKDASPVPSPAACQHDLVGVILISDLRKLSRDCSVPGKCRTSGGARVLGTQRLQRRVNEVVVKLAIAKEEEVQNMQDTCRILWYRLWCIQPLEVASDCE